MAKTRLELPSTFIFSTELEVRINDVNYVGHLGNDSVLSFAHEARVRFLRKYGYTEQNIAGVGLIMADAVIEYKNEAWQADKLFVEISVTDITRIGFNLYYRMRNMQTQKDIAFARTGMIFFDYQKRKISSVPQEFSEKFGLI